MTRGPSGSAVRSYIEPILAESQQDQTWIRCHWRKEAAGNIPGTGRSMTIRGYLMKVWIQSFAK
jgi:hypothetical protein